MPQIAIADINGDQKPDIVLDETPRTTARAGFLTYFNQGNDARASPVQRLLRNNGFLTIDSPAFQFTLLANGAKPNSMALGDLNNDGQVDIVLGDRAYNPATTSTPAGSGSLGTRRRP